MLMPKHPSEMLPHVSPAAAHVVFVQPQYIGVPGFPPPHVLGAVQSPFVVQPHIPAAVHVSGIVAVPPQMTPALIVMAPDQLVP